MTIRLPNRLLSGVAAALLGAGAVAWVTMYVAAERLLEAAASRSFAGAARVFAAMERADVETLDATITRITSAPGVVDLFLRGDRAGLEALVRPVFVELRANHGVDQLNFLLPDRRVFLRAQKPNDFGDRPARTVVSEAARTGEVAVGTDLGRTGFSLRVVRPLLRDGRSIGFVEIGELTGRFLVRMKERTGDDYALVVEKGHLDRAEWAGVREAAGLRDDWEGHPDAVVVDATYLDGRLLRGWRGHFEALPRDGVILGRSSSGDREQVVGIVPVWNAAGEHIGGLFVRHDTSALRGELKHQLRVLAVLLVLVTLVTVGALAVFTSRRHWPVSPVDPGA